MPLKSSISKRKVHAYIALAVSIALNAGALIILRALVGVISSDSSIISFKLLVRAISNWLFWAGGGSFVAGLYFWVQSLKVIPLSQAYPTAATSYIIIALFAWYFFDEPITLNRFLGMGIIIFGVAFLYRRDKVNI